jgi:hypothetical protein
MTFRLQSEHLLIWTRTRECRDRPTIEPRVCSRWTRATLSVLFDLPIQTVLQLKQP